MDKLTRFFAEYIINCLGLDAYLGWNTKETNSHLEELVRETTDS